MRKRKKPSHGFFDQWVLWGLFRRLTAVAVGAKCYLDETDAYQLAWLGSNLKMMLADTKWAGRAESFTETLFRVVAGLSMTVIDLELLGLLRKNAHFILMPFEKRDKKGTTYLPRNPVRNTGDCGLRFNALMED